MTDRPKRKSIPDRVKLQVVLQQDGRCPACGERLGALDTLNFDHRPAIINRPVNEDGTDYVPPQLDPEHIEAIHTKPCHDIRTNGPGGEKRITTAGSDKHIARKTKRLAEQREPPVPVEEERRLPPIDEFERRRSELLRPEPRPRAEKRSKWPSRPFPKKESRRG